MGLESGNLIGPYRILAPLGAGGMGEVYRARDTRLGRDVAIKVLPSTLASDEDSLRRFGQEARAASALNHPNILMIFDIGQADSVHFIATEFIDGETLRKRIQRNKMTPQEALDVAIQVVGALSAAHAAGIIHRDIKPENIMLRNDGYVKVLDFGLAKLAERHSPTTDTEALTFIEVDTDPETVMGTVTYMSPEQARGIAVDGRSDIFSLGVVLYEMLTNHSPFEAANTSLVIVSILEKEPPPLARYSPELPAKLQRIVDKALRKNREDRYQTIKDFLVDLKNLKQELESDENLGRSLSPESGGQTALMTGSQQMPDANAKQQSVQTGEAGSARTVSSAEYLMTEIKQYKRGAALTVAALVIAIVGIVYCAGDKGDKINSLAVLPFINSGDPNTEYLSDGITESIINSLSKLPNFAVISSTSAFRYKGREIDPQVVGRELKVRAVVTGRAVQRGDNLTISAELVDIRNNNQIWGEQYNRKLSDIIFIQAEISKEISEKLQLRLTGEQQKRLTKHYTEDTGAYQLYLRGRYYWNKRTGEDIKKGIEYLQQAIAKDPSFALAYAGLADCYHVIWTYSDMPSREANLKAKAAALKALEIDNTLAEAHTTLAGVEADEEWNWAAAENEFKRAIELNPNYATARQWYADYLAMMGQFDAAIAETKWALELDPLSLIVNAAAGETLIKARQYDRAIEQLRKTIEMDRNFLLAHSYLGDAFLEKGMYEEAIAQYQTAAIIGGQDSQKVANGAGLLRRAYAKSGAKGYWQKQLELALEAIKQGQVSPYSFAGAYSLSPYIIASLYARLGEKDLAFEWLLKAYEQHDTFIVYLKVDPQFDDLRSDPRAAELMQRIGLPR